MHTNHTDTVTREGERGAALITSLLISTLLLLAGGALLVRTTGSVAVAYGMTTEMQAYYSAEGGLQAALNVLRGNVQNAAGDKATFQDALDKDGGSLDAWLDYDTNVNGVATKKLGANSYRIVVTDPPPALVCPAPSCLLVTSTGYGPRGSRKQMEMLLRSSVTIDVPGGVTLRGSTSGAAADLIFDLGTSAQRNFLTDDAGKPVFITTNATDAGIVTGFIDGDKDKVTYGDPAHGDTEAGTAQLPTFLSDPALTEELIESLMSEDTDEDNITIIEGDGEMPKDGEGILLCTGKLSVGGNSVFRGIVLVLGEGYVEWKGEGTIEGAMFLANYDRVKLDGYDAATFSMSGAGTSTIRYSPDAVALALRQLSFRVVGVQEK